MAYLLDTGLFVLAVRNAPAFQAVDAALGILAGDFQPVLSIVSQGEVRGLALKLHWGEGKVKKLGELLAKMVIIPVDQPAMAERYAELEYENIRKGLNIGQNDLWIAATAIEYELTLLTADGDFDRCPEPLKYIRYDQHSGAELSRRD
jgi:tRNA(fMet)-specific endonuclease VapC